MIEEIKVGQKNILFAKHNGKLIYPNYAAKENLVLHYDFSGMNNSDVTKGIAKDLSHIQNNEELSNFAFDENSGYAEKGLSFDGVDDYINFKAPHEGAEFDESGITYCITFKANDVTGYRKGLFGQSLDYGFGSWSNGGFNITRGELSFAYNSGASEDYNAKYEISTEIEEFKIYQAVGTIYNGVSKLYINGNLIDSLIGSKVIRMQELPKANDIGRMMRTYYFNGIIYNVQIYKKELSLEEIQCNYQIDKKRFNITD